jgi:signal transduction histidine kinase
MLDNAGINFKYQLPDVIPQKIINSEEKRNLYLVVKEAVHNAIKHSRASDITLSVQIGHYLAISITDNGIGFNTEFNKLAGNGLNNYKKRMLLLKGTVTLESGPKGTTVTFQVPLL